jgi:predicted Ser/Thr protein kinase
MPLASTEETVLAGLPAGAEAVGLEEDGDTRLMAPAASPPPASDSRQRPGTGTGGALTAAGRRDGRFTPGTMIAERYRVVGLLGRGGMGEVYRAEDLRLDQSVALKFLPESVAADPSRLAQFHNEVRVARQVTHKNVCRMYDIGEVDGRPFLSMEYVDGEDLSTLLRRIGRLPQDKAVQMARQLCAGLAAAHERGVLHRDLKPANVMVDGEGQVRLTDFGIAGTAEEAVDARAGTPGYMAPEQLSGGRVSVQSDLFALGLVIFEMFTGKRGIEAKTFDELLRLHERGLELSTTAMQPDIDPAVDRVIRRCLARDPADRPTSALAVSAALPGGDPLAAALAAGETPSPEMVAAAGRSEAVPARTALSLTAVVLVGLAFVSLLGDRQLLIRRVPLDRPPAVLADRARTMVASLGYTEAPVDRAWGLAYHEDFMRYVRQTRGGEDRWAWLATGRTPAVVFYYRESPRRLRPVGITRRPTLNDPPPVISGMTSLLLDSEGRLLELSAVPPQRETGVADEGGGRVPDWAALFAAAGLDPARFTPAAPEWTPRTFADVRAAWTGSVPELDDVPLRVEAASYRGRPVFFSVVAPWTRAARMEEAPQTTINRVAVGLTTLMVALILVSAVVMTRNNLRTGRGDRAGAARLALVVLGLNMTAWVLGAHHFSDAATEMNQFFVALALSLLSAGLIWIAYLALEPIVRRRWAAGMIGWTRLLAGRWRDPLVGRDVLIGLTTGFALTLVVRTANHAHSLFGLAPGNPALTNPEALGGVHLWLSVLLVATSNVVTTTLLVTLLFVMIRVWVRWRVVAFALSAVLFMLLIGGEVLAGEMPLLEVAMALTVASILVAVTWRFGVLALAATVGVNQIVFASPIVTDLTTWYAPQTLGALALVIGLAVLALSAARDGEPLFGRRILED